MCIYDGKAGDDAVHPKVLTEARIYNENIPRLSTICLQRIVRYFGHVARRDTSNLERLVVTGKIEGKRPRGRSPKLWSDQIVEELQIPVSDALHQATERDQWRRLVDGIKRSHDPQ
ncbi:hypothetical protein ACJJTC_009318 [Scirpophaga incertulas]